MASLQCSFCSLGRAMLRTGAEQSWPELLLTPQEPGPESPPCLLQGKVPSLQGNEKAGMGYAGGPTSVPSRGIYLDVAIWQLFTRIPAPRACPQEEVMALVHPLRDAPRYIKHPHSCSRWKTALGARSCCKAYVPSKEGSIKFFALQPLLCTVPGSHAAWLL